MKRADIRIINREKGSGARVLLDEQLGLLGVKPVDVKGYGDIVTDHYAAASQVSSGQADAGIGRSTRHIWDVLILSAHR